MKQAGIGMPQSVFRIKLHAMMNTVLPVSKVASLTTHLFPIVSNLVNINHCQGRHTFPVPFVCPHWLFLVICGESLKSHP